MNVQTEVVKEEDVKVKFVKKKLTKKFKIVGIILLACVVILIGVGSSTLFKSKSTKLGFEDIGELATQTAYCTQVSVTEDSRTLFGAKIPFTQSKYIYSYDVVIKAGFDFTKIKWSENGTSIEVKLPEAEVLSTEIDLDSFKVYHEDESIFNQITLSESNDALKDLKENAEKDAVENGLLENARTNAETILTGFFGKSYDLKKYEIVYSDL